MNTTNLKRAVLALIMTTAGATATVNAADVPARETSGGSNIYGYLVYTENDDASKGMYELTKSGARLKWEAPVRSYDFYSGWLKDGKICAFAEDNYYGNLRGLKYVETDFATGAVLTQTDIATTAVHYDIATYNPADNTIYGYGKDSTGKYAFMKSSPSSPTELEVVCNVPETQTMLCLTYCPADGLLYGINRNYTNEFVSVTTAGVQTPIFSINSSTDLSEYVTGLVYAPVEKLFYWNRYEGWDDFKSQLCTIDPVAKKITSVRTYSNVEQFSFFVTTDVYVEDGQPAAPSIVSVQFNKAALTGVMTAKMPTLDVNGTALSGKVGYSVYVDDVVYKTGQANVGATEVITLTDMTQGNHTFAIDVTAGNLTSERAFVNKYVGNDIPKAPANVVLTEASLRWDAVTEGVNGGYLDLANMQYEVTLNGESKGKTSATSMAGIIDLNSPLAFYTASVKAVCTQLESQAATSNRLLAGSALNLPVDLVPTKEQFELMQCFDLDGDSYSWKCRDGYMESQWSLSKTGGNDWVVLAPINFADASAIYEISYEARRKMVETGRESLDVMIGTQADPTTMTQVLVENYEPLTEFETRKAMFHVPASGTYYIAFHATSMKWEAGIENGMMVRNIKVAKSELNASSPGAVTDLKAERAAKGGLSATVTFKMPALTYNGAALDASADITAVVTAENEQTVTGKPGQAMSVTVNTRQGQNTINVVTSMGQTAGTPASVAVYTGVVTPTMARDLKFTIADDMKSVTLAWTAPEEENSNGYVNPAGVYYRIYEAVQSFYDMTWELRGTTKPGETTFTFAQEADAQKVHTLTVMACNVAGNCDDMPGGEVLLGKPYELPMLEDFEVDRDYFRYTPWIQYQPEEDFTGRWSVWPGENVLIDGEGNVLVARPVEATGKACIGVPGFTAKGDGGCAISFDVLLNANTPAMEVRGICAGVDEETVIGAIPTGDDDEPTKVTFRLPVAFEKADWVQLYFYATFTSSTNLLIIDNVCIEKTEESGVGTLTNLGDDTADVWTISGVCVGRNMTASEIDALAPGLYILHTAEKTFKIMK